MILHGITLSSPHPKRRQIALCDGTNKMVDAIRYTDLMREIDQDVDPFVRVVHEV